MLSSPCIRICRFVDYECLGCFRTLTEVNEWTQLDDIAKRLVVAETDRRRERYWGALTRTATRA